MSDWDFGTHTEPDKNLIAGFVIPKSQEFFQLEDGRTGVSVLAKIWKRYASKAMDIFKEKFNKLKLQDNNYEDEYCILCLCF